MVACKEKGELETSFYFMALLSVYWALGKIIYSNNILYKLSIYLLVIPFK